jgi:hypothetical protein
MDSSAWLSSTPHSRLQPLYPFGLSTEYNQDASREDGGRPSDAARQEQRGPVSACDGEVRAGLWSALFD